MTVTPSSHPLTPYPLLCMYVYTLPTTGKVAFHDFLHTERYAEELAAATQLRAAVQQWLKTQQAAPDALRTLQLVSDYLPYLVGVYNAQLTDNVLVAGTPRYVWSSALSGATAECAALSFELAFVLVVHAMALSNHAAALVDALGAYELDVREGADARAAGDEKLRAAADHLCRTSGAFAFVATHIVPQWSREWDVGVPDVAAETCLALSNMALADANALAIRRLLAPARAHATDTLTPGPPLPPGHPSPSLLAKLEVYVADRYAEARALLRTHERRVPDGGGGGAPGRWAQMRHAVGTLRAEARSLVERRVPPALLRHLEGASAWHRALAYKWLGVDAESAGDAGRAVAFLDAAARQMSEQVPRGGALQRARTGAAWRAAAAARGGAAAWRELEYANVCRLADVCRRLNDKVAFQRVPTDVHLAVPGGRAALEPRAYAPPVPAFGPLTAVDGSALLGAARVPPAAALY